MGLQQGAVKHWHISRLNAAQLAGDPALDSTVLIQTTWAGVWLVPPKDRCRSRFCRIIARQPCRLVSAFASQTYGFPHSQQVSSPEQSLSA